MRATCAISSATLSPTRNPGIDSSLSSVPPVCASPRPESLATGMPMAAASGAERDRRLVPHAAGRVLVDDRAPERREVDRRARVDHRLRQLVRLGVREPAPDDRHRPCAHLLGRDATGDVALDQPRHLARRVLGAVALALDQLDGSHRADRRCPAGRRPSCAPSHAATVAPTSANSPSCRPAGARPGHVRDEQRVLARMIRRGRRRDRSRDPR